MPTPRDAVPDARRRRAGPAPEGPQAVTVATRSCPCTFGEDCPFAGRDVGSRITLVGDLHLPYPAALWEVVSLTALIVIPAVLGAVILGLVPALVMIRHRARSWRRQP